tara:strand:- start:3 stop:662 length:660 start_codon:yes stop_codon:yes gene_type:complete
MYKDTKTSQIENLHDIYQDVFGDKDDGFFVEVGAYDGHRWSNTTPLIEADWSGIMVEPVSIYYEACESRYKDNDKIEISNCCIGWENKDKQKVYFGGPLTTIVEEMVSIYNQTDPRDNHSLDNYSESTMYTLDTFLEDKKVEKNFDVLSIDVEGAEWKILEVFNIDEWNPKMAIVETHEKHENELKRKTGNSEVINEYFFKHNYEQIYVDEVNSIYIYE